MPWLSCPNLIHPRRRRVNAPLLRESLLCYLRPNDSFSTEHTWPCLLRKRTLLAHRALLPTATCRTGRSPSQEQTLVEGTGRVLHPPHVLRGAQRRPRAGPLEDEPSPATSRTRRRVQSPSSRHRGTAGRLRTRLLAPVPGVSWPPLSISRDWLPPLNDSLSEFSILPAATPVLAPSVSVAQ